MKTMNILRSILKYLVSFLLLVNVISITFGVFTRFVINMSLGWTDEVAGFSLVWITFLGATWAVIDQDHLGFDSLVAIFPEKVRKSIDIFVKLIILGSCILLVVTGYQVTGAIWGNTAISIPVSKGLIFSIVPFSAALMALAIITQLVDAIFHKS